MTEPDFDPEKLRPAEHICEPDPRNTIIVWRDPATGAFRSRESQRPPRCSLRLFPLNAGVPEHVAQHFETAKNLYLYSWFIYRFQPVAELQSLACLEFASTRAAGARNQTAGKIKKNTLGNA